MPTNEAEEEIITPTAAALLQLTQHASAQAPNPTEYLSSIIACMDGLQLQLTALQSEAALAKRENVALHHKLATIEETVASKDKTIVTLQYDVATLQRNNGGDFVFFARLPKEVRNMIWWFSIQQRQFCAIRYKAGLTSRKAYVEGPNHPELQICHESRSAALGILRQFAHSSASTNVRYPRKSYYNPGGALLFVNYSHEKSRESCPRLSELLGRWWNDDVKVRTVAVYWEEFYWYDE